MAPLFMITCAVTPLCCNSLEHAQWNRGDWGEGKRDVIWTSVHRCPSDGGGWNQHAAGCVANTQGSRRWPLSEDPPQGNQRARYSRLRLCLSRGTQNPKAPGWLVPSGAVSRESAVRDAAPCSLLPRSARRSPQHRVTPRGRAVFLNRVSHVRVVPGAPGIKGT